MVQDWPAEYPRQGGYPCQIARYPGRDEGRQDAMADSYRRHPPLVRHRGEPISRGAIADQKQQIAEALRRYCGIEADQYFLAVRKHDSSVATFFSPSQLRHGELLDSFFNEDRFRQATSQLDQSTLTSLVLGTKYLMM
jgi:hypothetical protein